MSFLVLELSPDFSWHLPFSSPSGFSIEFPHLFPIENLIRHRHHYQLSHKFLRSTIWFVSNYVLFNRISIGIRSNLPEEFRSWVDLKLVIFLLMVSGRSFLYVSVTFHGSCQYFSMDSRASFSNFNHPSSFFLPMQLSCSVFQVLDIIY